LERIFYEGNILGVHYITLCETTIYKSVFEIMI
jgi:hypothetical protein